ncbi:Histone-lysine N-methyltransferase setd3 [Bonamia ostreae]|uniref:Histone-lysine N-methyltransferase setd3 n=1 Tax=Bonamia ostreae TaxID=126728 RepID=A0ABV2ASI4_9EUKA
MPPLVMKDFFWALSVVMSRQNLLPGIGYSLIPIWDFCNHKNGEITSSFSDGNCESFAIKDFRRGEEIHICYGERPNYKLFLYSGFVLDGLLPFDSVPFSIDVMFEDDNILLRANKKKNAEKYLAVTTGTVLVHNVEESVQKSQLVKELWYQNILGVCRVATASKEEMKIMWQKNNLMEPLSPENEAKSVERLIKVISNHVGKLQSVDCESAFAANGQRAQIVSSMLQLELALFNRFMAKIE